MCQIHERDTSPPKPRHAHRFPARGLGPCSRYYRYLNSLIDDFGNARQYDPDDGDPSLCLPGSESSSHPRTLADACVQNHVDEQFYAK